MSITEIEETSSDLSELTRAAAELKRNIGIIEGQLLEKKERFQKITETILKTMDLTNLDSLRAHGFLFFKETRQSIKTPSDPADKKLLFEFLESKGIFLETVSVNSQTLNALFKSLSDEAVQNGDLDFKLPGVGEPTSYTTLKLKKG